MMTNERKVFTEEEITEVIKDAMEHFCETVDFDISLENTKLAFFTPKNGKEVYERFCNSYFKGWNKYEVITDEYFKTFVAQAFVGKKYYGIMIRTDLSFTPPELFKIVMHELSHIFCVENELDGDNFFDKYCCGKGIADGIINAGYAIWRETVADIMADSILSENCLYWLDDIKEAVLEEYEEISPTNPQSKKNVSVILAALFNTREIGGKQDWAEAGKDLRNTIEFDSEAMYQITEIVYRKLNERPFWKISRDYIEELGNAYMLMMTDIAIRRFKDVLNETVIHHKKNKEG